jgi:hypothetical protein
MINVRTHTDVDKLELSPKNVSGLAALGLEMGTPEREIQYLSGRWCYARIGQINVRDGTTVRLIPSVGLSKEQESVLLGAGMKVSAAVMAGEPFTSRDWRKQPDGSYFSWWWVLCDPICGESEVASSKGSFVDNTLGGASRST